LSTLPELRGGIKGWGAMAVGIITNYADMILDVRIINSQQSTVNINIFHNSNRIAIYAISQILAVDAIAIRQTLLVSRVLRRLNLSIYKGYYS